MTYDVRVTSAARRHLNRLKEGDRAAVLETVFGPLAANPRRLGKPLQLQLEGLYGARRGHFRIVYLIDDAARTVTILRIADRGDVYRR